MGSGALSAPEYQEEMALGRKRVLARGRVGPLHSFIPLLGRRGGSEWTNWNPFHGVPWLRSEDKKEPLFLKTIWRAAYFHFGWLQVSHATHTHVQVSTPHLQRRTHSEMRTHNPQKFRYSDVHQRESSHPYAYSCAPSWSPPTHSCKPTPLQQSPAFALHRGTLRRLSWE